MKNINVFILAITKAIWFLILLILIATIIWPCIGPDGGYYLSIARDFYQSEISIYNILCGYNPLGILVLGFPYCISENNPYQYSLLVLIFIQLANTYLFYQVLRKIEVPLLYIELFTSFFLIYSLLLDGTFILLEPVQILFLLITTLFLLNEKYFLSGLSFFLAFYAKQYSIAYIAGFLFWIILDEGNIREKFLKFFRFITGFTVMLILFYFILAKSIKFPEYLFNLAGIRIFDSMSIAQVTGVGYSFRIFLKTLMWVLMIAPVLFLWIINLKNLKINRINCFLIGNIIGFSTMFLFAAYFHYFIVLIPWCLVCTSLILCHQRKGYIIFNNVIFSLALVSVSLFTVKNIRNRAIVYRKEMETKKIISSVIPKGTKTFIYGANPAQYIYSSLRSANSRELGYMFPNLRELNYFMDKMDEESLIILSINDIEKINDKDKFRLYSKTNLYAIFKKEKQIDQ